MWHLVEVLNVVTVPWPLRWELEHTYHLWFLCGPVSCISTKDYHVMMFENGKMPHGYIQRKEWLNEVKASLLRSSRTYLPGPGMKIMKLLWKICTDLKEVSKAFTSVVSKERPQFILQSKTQPPNELTLAFVKEIKDSFQHCAFPSTTTETVSLRMRGIKATYR